MNNSSLPLNSVAAVIVTFNRLTLLKECIAAVRNQTIPPNEIIVINNSSTDSTAEWLNIQNDVIVVTQPNAGSSGGQSTGIRTAYERGHDWFWCMDDDTIPEPTVLEELKNCFAFGDKNTGFICSLTVDINGNIFYPLQPISPGDWLAKVLDTKCIRVRESTFVSVMFSRTAVASVGLPLFWMFIWGDDIEYTRRVTCQHNGWLMLSSRVVHKWAARPDWEDPYSTPIGRQRQLYLIRNTLINIRCDTTISIRTRWQLKFGVIRRAIGLILLHKMPTCTICWIWDGLFRKIVYDYPK